MIYSHWRWEQHHVHLGKHQYSALKQLRIQIHPGWKWLGGCYLLFYSICFRTYKNYRVYYRKNAFKYILDVNQYMRQLQGLVSFWWLNLYFPMGMFIISRTFLFVLSNIRAKGGTSMYWLCGKVRWIHKTESTFSLSKRNIPFLNGFPMLLICKQHGFFQLPW